MKIYNGSPACILFLFFIRSLDNKYQTSLADTDHQHNNLRFTIIISISIHITYAIHFIVHLLHQYVPINVIAQKNDWGNVDDLDPSKLGQWVTSQGKSKSPHEINGSVNSDIFCVVRY